MCCVVYVCGVLVLFVVFVCACKFRVFACVVLICFIVRSVCFVCLCGCVGFACVCCVLLLV